MLTARSFLLLSFFFSTSASALNPQNVRLRKISCQNESNAQQVELFVSSQSHFSYFRKIVDSRSEHLEVHTRTNNMESALLNVSLMGSYPLYLGPLNNSRFGHYLVRFGETWQSMNQQLSIQFDDDTESGNGEWILPNRS